MRDDVRYIAGGDVAIRDDADGDGRTIEGYAVRWGQLSESGATKEYGQLREGFARGSFADAIAERGERPFPFLDRHGPVVGGDGRVVGGIRFDEDDVGLHYTGRLLDTPAARDYAASVPAGYDAVSLEFMYRGATSKRQGKSIVHTRIPRIAALAGAYSPAHGGATIALREDGGTNVSDDIETPEVETPEVETEQPVAARQMVKAVVPLSPEQIAVIARDVATEAVRGYAERGTFGGGTSEADPFAGYASIGELMKAAWASRGEAVNLDAKDAPIVPGKDDLRSYAARALADIVFTAGANAALASGNLVTQDIKRIVTRGRPAITAFGGPRPLGDTAGLTLEWAYFDGTLTDYVAAQSAEKAEIESATVDIKLDTEALITYAGGADIAYQVIRRGNPSILDVFARIMLAAYAAVTDAAFVTELESGSVTVDYAEALSAHDLAEFTANLITASLAVEAASGEPADFILASSTAFARLANLIVPSTITVAGASSADLRGLRFQLGNVPIIHVPGITADKIIISNQAAAAWFEDGPFQVSAEDVAHLGRDVAYWGMGAGARFIPAAIVEVYDVTP